MRCFFCGGENPDDIIFCENCGRRIAPGIGDILEDPQESLDAILNDKNSSSNSSPEKRSENIVIKLKSDSLQKMGSKKESKESDDFLSRMKHIVKPSGEKPEKKDIKDIEDLLESTRSEKKDKEKKHEESEKEEEKDGTEVVPGKKKRKKSAAIEKEEVEDIQKPLKPEDMKPPSKKEKEKDGIPLLDKLKNIVKKPKRMIQEGRYEIIRKIGAGGMGKIYLALDVKMEADVVIKEMNPPDESSDSNDYFHRQFREEAKILYRLSYRGIPKVTDYFTEKNKSYLVMEYVEGENLDVIIRERKEHCITVDEFFRWMEQLIETLSYLHGKKPPLIHRDIKPANLMLNLQGNMLLVDFGLAKSLVITTATQTRVGTMGFASPEHFAGRFSVASDIFSMGASFHFLITGEDPRIRLPFEYPTVSDYRDDLPAGVDILVEKMVEKDEADRYRTIEDVRKDFEAIKKHWENPEKPLILPSGTDLGTIDVGTSQPVEEKAGSLKLAKPIETAKLGVSKIVGNKMAIAVIIIILLGGLIFNFYYQSRLKKKKEKYIPQVTTGDLNEKSGARDIFQKGKKLAEEGKYDEAVEILSRAVKLDSRYVDARMERGKAYLKLEDFDHALSDFSKVISINPKNIEAYQYRSQIYLKKKDYKSAVDDLTGIIKRNPASSECYIKRAEVYKKWRKTDKAISDLENALSIDKNLTSVKEELGKLFFERGNEAMEKGEMDQAINDLKRLLKIDPDYPEAAGMLAKAYLARAAKNEKDGKTKSAIEDFKHALKYDPYLEGVKEKVAAIYYNRAMKFRNEKKYKQSRADFDMAIKHSPNFADAYFQRGYVNLVMKNKKAAIMDFETTLRLKPDHRYAHKYLSKMKDSKKPMPIAARTPPSVISTKAPAFPDIPPSTPSTPVTPVAYNTPKEPVKKPEPSPSPSEEFVGNKQDYVMRAEQLVSQGKYKESLKISNKAFGIDPDYPEAWLVRGKAYYGIGDYQKARGCFLIAVKSVKLGTPVSNEANEYLDKLEKMNVPDLPMPKKP